MTAYAIDFDEALIEALYMAGRDPAYWRPFLKSCLATFNVQLAMVHHPGMMPATVFEVERKDLAPDELVATHVAALTEQTAAGGHHFDTHALTLVVDDGGRIGITLVRDTSRPPFTVQGRTGLLSLAPYLTQVLKARPPRPAGAVDRQFLTALDSLALPCLVFGKESDLVFSNQAANALLDEGLGLRRDGKHLVFESETVEAAFANALRTFADRPGAAAVEIIIPRPDALPHLAVVAPVVPPVDKKRSLVAVVYIVEAEVRLAPGAGPARLCAAYGLTMAEASIALLILSGQSAAQIAKHRKVSLHTVRAQIKQILDKTHAHGQSGLFKLLGFFNA